MAKCGRLELGDNIYGYYKSIVIEVGTNQKPVCDFLLVINSN